MRSNLIIVVSAIAALAVCDYWLFPPAWALLAPAAVAVLWAVGALLRARDLTRSGLGAVSKKPALGLLLATIAVVGMVFWLRPVARLRIAASAHALADAAAASVEYPAPRRIGFFDVEQVWRGDDAVGFKIRDGWSGLPGWHTTLGARIVGVDGVAPVLRDWTWHLWIE